MPGEIDAWTRCDDQEKGKVHVGPSLIETNLEEGSE